MDRADPAGIGDISPVETPGLAALAPADQQQALLDQTASQVPMKRLGHVDEIASAVLFLAPNWLVDGGPLQL